jgi:TRAP-type C4-dicarboxylate transport system permease small subunit
MPSQKALALALLVAGILALVYGGFTYTKQTHRAKLGPLDFSIKEKESVNVPAWVGVGAIVVGGALLVSGRKSS